MKLQECINYIINRAQQAVTQVFREQLAPYDITPAQYAILKCLWTESGISPKDLALRLGLDPPAITGVLDRLENKGLIARVPDSADRRAINIFPTTKAVSLNVPINEAIEESNKRALKNLSPEEQIQLKNLLERLFQQ